LAIKSLDMDRYNFSSSIESSLAMNTYWDQDWRRAYLIPLRIPFTLYAPFPPIHFNNIYGAMGNLNVLLLILITPGIIGAIYCKKFSFHKRVLKLSPVWIPVLALGTALSAGMPIIQWRYAIMAYPFMIILAAIGFENWKYTKRFYLHIFIATLMICVLYFVLKNT